MAAVYRVRMSNQSGSLINKVPPVIVKFTDKKMARKVYKAKASLAASGIFIGEALPRTKRDLLNATKRNTEIKMLGPITARFLQNHLVKTMSRKFESNLTVWNKYLFCWVFFLTYLFILFFHLFVYSFIILSLLCFVHCFIYVFIFFLFIYALGGDQGITVLLVNSS